MTEALFALLVLGLIVGSYFLPTIVAWYRYSTLTAPTLVINLFFGWTFIGWVIALMMAVWPSKRR